jgi:hypothetical protein
MQGRHSCLRIQMDPPTRVTLQGWLHRQKTPNVWHVVPVPCFC